MVSHNRRLLFGLLVNLMLVVLCCEAMDVAQYREKQLPNFSEIANVTAVLDNSSIVLSSSSLVRNILLDRFSLDDFLALIFNISSPLVIFRVDLNDTDSGELLTIHQTTEANFQLLTTHLLMTWSNLVPSIVIVLCRLLFLVFLVLLLVLCLVYRKREPIRRKLPISLSIIILGLFTNFRSIVETIPVRKLIFSQYWNQYLAEKTVLSPLEFFQKYSQHGIPNWMFDITYFENIMCYSVTFGINTFYIFSIVLYFTHMTKFMLDRIISKKKVILKDSLDKLKESGVKSVVTSNQPSINIHTAEPIEITKSIEIELVENDPAIIAIGDIVNDHMSPLIIDKDTGIDNSLVISPETTQNSIINDNSVLTSQQQGDSGTTNNQLSISDVTLGDLTSTAFTDIDEIFLTDVDTFATDEKENGLATEGYGNITESTKVLKIIQFIQEKKVIQILFSAGLFIIWFIMASLILVFWKDNSQFLSLFPIFETIQGICSYGKRSATGTFSLLFGLLFPIVIVFVYSIDVFQSLSEYRKQKVLTKRNNRTESMPHFLTYYFIDTDLFLYRVECLMLFVIGALSVCLYAIFWDDSGRDQTRVLVSNLVSLFGIEFLVILIMPGISIFATVYRNWKENKLYKQNENVEHRNVLSLNSFAPGTECIDFLLTHQIERQLFYKYLTSEFSQENLLFMEDIMRFRQIPPQKLRYKIMKLREIITLYLIQNTSVFEVNISKKLIDTEIQPYIIIENILHYHSINMIALPKFIKETPKISSFPEPLQQNDTDRELLLNAFKEINQPTYLKGVITEAYSNLMDSYVRFIRSRVWQEHVEKLKEVE